MIDFIKQVEMKIIEIDQVANYERMKALDYKEEADKLIEELNKEREHVIGLKKDVTKTHQYLEHQESFILKLQECLQSLKQS